MFVPRIKIFLENCFRNFKGDPMISPFSFSLSISLFVGSLKVVEG